MSGVVGRGPGGRPGKVLLEHFKIHKFPEFGSKVRALNLFLETDHSVTVSPHAVSSLASLSFCRCIKQPPQQAKRVRPDAELTKSFV